MNHGSERILLRFRPQRCRVNAASANVKVFRYFCRPVYVSSVRTLTCVPAYYSKCISRYAYTSVSLSVENCVRTSRAHPSFFHSLIHTHVHTRVHTHPVTHTHHSTPPPPSLSLSIHTLADPCAQAAATQQQTDLHGPGAETASSSG